MSEPANTSFGPKTLHTVKDFKTINHVKVEHQLKPSQKEEDQEKKTKFEV
jgi:hypothetical protein